MRPLCFAPLPDPDIVRNLSSAPWPYGPADAEALASRPFDPKQPRHFIFRSDAAPEELIGVAGLDLMPDGDMELGYWIAKGHWGRGYAFEAAVRMIEITRTELNLKRLSAGYFVDNPASGRVLEKLGFVPVPGLTSRHSRARGEPAPCQICALAL